MSNTIEITQGNESDKETAAQLIYLALGDFAKHLFGTENDSEILSFASKLWLMHNTRMSKSYSYVARQDGKPIGLLTSYGGGLTGKLFLRSFLALVRIDRHFLRYLVRHVNYFIAFLRSPEANKDEYYIFVLAVLPEFQENGIGTRLLEFADIKAREQGYNKVSLLVGIDKSAALKFYKKRGFKNVLEYKRSPMFFYKMVKEL